MITHIPITADATIYDGQFKDINTGLDEIVEIGKTSPDASGVSLRKMITRSLMWFDSSKLFDCPPGARFFLSLRLAHAADIKRYQEIEVHPLEDTWVEGSGYFYQSTVNARDGVTWTERTTGLPWATPGSSYNQSIVSTHVVKEYPVYDVRIDITDIIAPLFQSPPGYNWYGIILKFPDADESNSANQGNIKFFSSNTHTIYAPQIEVVWDSQTFVTGSLKTIPDNRISVMPRNLKEAYKTGESDRIRLVVRDLYPDKRFDSVRRHDNKYYLPETTYYKITDVSAGTPIHDFSDYSRVSCDASGSYIILDTGGLSVDRYYSIELKVATGDLVFFPNFNYTFKIESNG